MKNQLFKHLLEKFEKNLPEGGRENPANTRYFDTLDALRAAAQAVEESQNLDAPDYAEKAEPVKAAFGKLKAAQEALLAEGRENLPEQLQGAYTALKAAQKPIEFYEAELSEGRTLRDTLSDSSWMKDFFTQDTAVSDRADYVPGQYDISGKSYREILDAYKADAAEAKARYVQHLKNISGDDYDPEGMIQEKLSVMQEFIDSHENEPSQAALKALIGEGYINQSLHYDEKNITDVSSGEHIMSSDFFGYYSDMLFESTQVAGAIDAMKTLPEADRKLMNDEVRKLRFKSKQMGITDEMMERFDKNSFCIQSLGKDVYNLKFNNPEAENDAESQKYLPAVEALLNKTAAYLRGDEGAEAPADEEFLNLAEELNRIRKETPLYLPDGNFNPGYGTLYNMLTSITESVPGISEQLQPAVADMKKEIRVEYLKNQELLLQDLPPKARRNVELGLKETVNNRLADRSFQMDAVYVRMARDPEFCSEMLERTGKVMDSFAKNINGKNAGKSDDPLFARFNMMTGETFPAEQLYDDAYTTFLMGKQIEAAREKLSAKSATGADRLKNTANPQLSAIMGEKEPSEISLNSVRKAVEDIRSSGIFKSIKASGPVVMASLIKKEDMVKVLAEELTSPEMNLLKGVSDEALSALNQDSGFMYRDNSESYQRMSDALKDIYKKNAVPGGAKKEDYVRLYEACRDYSHSHDAVPTTTNGKKRQIASMSVMRTIGANLARKDPEFAKQFELDNAVNMARSKDYRDAAAVLANSRLNGILENHRDSLGTKQGYEALSQDVKSRITDCLVTIGTARDMDRQLAKASGQQIGGKYTDLDVRDAVDTAAAGAMGTCNAALRKLSQDPAAALSGFMPKPEAQKAAKQAAAPANFGPGLGH